MRRLLLPLVLALPVLSAFSCKPKGEATDAGPEAAPSASASTPEVVDAAPEASAATTAHANVVGIPFAGGPCKAGADTLACSPDHNIELTCAGGTWAAKTACRGAGVCKGTGAGTTCDIGNLIIGDPCVPGNPPSKCASSHAVQQCNNGRWAENVCMPPQTCKGSPPACSK
jgi:hypothetical protein